MKPILATLALLAFHAAAFAAPGQWLTDHDKAFAQAKAENKPVVINFTGSDWCGWCIKLKNEVFSKPEFKKFAGESVVLLEVDFPRGKQVPPKTKEANTALAKKYGVRGFPSIMVTDGDGTVIGQTGYKEGGPQPFIAEIKKITGK